MEFLLRFFNIIAKKIGKKFGGLRKRQYLCIGFREESKSVTFSTILTIFIMSKKEFLERRNAEKIAKKVAIAQTGINENYDAQSAEYKAFRCKVNKWQKECRDYYNEEYGLQFKGCFRFEVLSGTFKRTEFGKIFLTKISEEDTADLNTEMRELEEEFSTKVCKK